MTDRDDILRMAREQGLPETEVEGVFRVNSDDLGRLLAAEREACARVCEGRLQEGLNFEGCAAAIRARGQPDPKVTHLNEWARDRLARHGIQIPEDEDGNPSF